MRLPWQAFAALAARHGDTLANRLDTRFGRNDHGETPCSQARRDPEVMNHERFFDVPFRGLVERLLVEERLADARDFEPDRVDPRFEPRFV